MIHNASNFHKTHRTPIAYLPPCLSVNIRCLSYIKKHTGLDDQKCLMMHFLLRIFIRACVSNKRPQFIYENCTQRKWENGHSSGCPWSACASVKCTAGKADEIMMRWRANAFWGDVGSSNMGDGKNLFPSSINESCWSFLTVSLKMSCHEKKEDNDFVDHY